MPSSDAQTSSKTGETRGVAIALNVQHDDALVLLFPLDNSGRRPAYTHKAAGMAAAGQLHWQTAAHEEHYLSGARDAPIWPGPAG